MEDFIASLHEDPETASPTHSGRQSTVLLVRSVSASPASVGDEDESETDFDQRRDPNDAKSGPPLEPLPSNLAIALRAALERQREGVDVELQSFFAANTDHSRKSQLSDADRARLQARRSLLEAFDKQRATEEVSRARWAEKLVSMQTSAPSGTQAIFILIFVCKYV